MGGQVTWFPRIWTQGAKTPIGLSGIYKSFHQIKGVSLQVAENLWKSLFKNIHLTKKVRSQDGSQFSEILTQIGHGKVRENDNIFNFLKSRDVPCDLENDFESWKMGEILYIVKDNKKREEINMRKLSEFKPNESIFCSEAKDTALDSDREANLSNDVPYTQTG